MCHKLTDSHQEGLLMNCVFVGNLQKKYFGAWKMSKGKGAPAEDEKPKEKSPEKSTEESEDEEVCVHVWVGA